MACFVGSGLWQPSRAFRGIEWKPLYAVTELSTVGPSNDSMDDIDAVSRVCRQESRLRRTDCFPKTFECTLYHPNLVDRGT